MTDVLVPSADGSSRTLTLHGAPGYTRPAWPIAGRSVYAAAHVIPHPWADNAPGRPAEIDWDATLAFRHHLWSWGLGVADAMDTAQRNMGLDWAATAELIRRSAGEAASVGGGLVVGVNTDHLADPAPTLAQVTDAYLYQLGVAQEAGADIVLMASRHLARAAQSAADYERVYSRVISHSATPVVLHWLGSAFDDQLAGYWGAGDVPTASATVLRVIEAAGDRVRGIKLSLLDPQAERDLRRELPRGVRMFTGDDFNYVGLIEGDEDGHSDALLGAFAAIAPSASAALQRLEVDDTEGYRRILEPTEALSRAIFEAPTPFYKTGVAFLSWLNGHQSSPAMVGGLHAARSLPHLGRLIGLADAAGALEDPGLAAERWSALLAVNGIR